MSWSNECHDNNGKNWTHDHHWHATLEIKKSLNSFFLHKKDIIYDISDTQKLAHVYEKNRILSLIWISTELNEKKYFAIAHRPIYRQCKCSCFAIMLLYWKSRAILCETIAYEEADDLCPYHSGDDEGKASRRQDDSRHLRPIIKLKTDQNKSTFFSHVSALLRWVSLPQSSPPLNQILFSKRDPLLVHGHYQFLNKNNFKKFKIFLFYLGKSLNVHRFAFLVSILPDLNFFLVQTSPPQETRGHCLL